MSAAGNSASLVNTQVNVAVRLLFADYFATIINQIKKVRSRMDALITDRS